MPPPTTGTHAKDMLYEDDNGAIWSCRVGGTPGEWEATVPIAFEDIPAEAVRAMPPELRRAAKQGQRLGKYPTE
jgi:hypothetical protein